MANLPSIQPGYNQSIISDAQSTLTGKYYKRYYACTMSSGSNILTENTLTSDSYRSSSTGDQYLDFDLTIDQKTNIEGRAIICLTQEQTASSPDTNVEIKISGSKVTGSTPSVLASTQTPATSGTANLAQRRVVYMDIPKTTFLRGEKFRLSVLKNHITGAGTTALYHDPAGRLASAYGDGSHTTHSTTFTIDLPFAQQKEF